MRALLSAEDTFTAADGGQLDRIETALAAQGAQITEMHAWLSQLMAAIHAHPLLSRTLNIR